ncbi:hypothetical protein TSOC111612_02895 [Tsukamurella ocularis]
MFDVATIETPRAASSVRSRDITIVSPGSSSSNSSMQITLWFARYSTHRLNPSAPTRWVYSTKVPNDFGDGTLWKIDARRWVLPTPKPPSR